MNVPNLPTPGCPQCHADPRLCKKAGPTYRKKSKDDRNAKIQQYQCTECGYKARGTLFHLPEVME